MSPAPDAFIVTSTYTLARLSSRASDGALLFLLFDHAWAAHGEPALPLQLLFSEPVLLN